MRAKVARMLRKMAYGPEGSTKGAREYAGGWKKVVIAGKDGKKRDKWLWFPLTSTGQRYTYRRLKKEYARGQAQPQLRDRRL